MHRLPVRLPAVIDGEGRTVRQNVSSELSHPRVPVAVPVSLHRVLVRLPAVIDAEGRTV
jgi:hypothetical protein